MASRQSFAIGEAIVEPGTRKTVELPVSVLSDHTPVTLSVHVIHGRRPGPVVFVSAAVHGDEVIGVEIARRLLGATQLDKLQGTLLVIPIVNSFGFLNSSRYLPDRRDLNRCFPGSERGSLASRLARLFMEEIVDRSEFGIDLHSAAIHRMNMPQIRVSPLNERTMELADAFGAPVVIRAKLREGSLREAARERGVDMLLYEAGEGLRFDEVSVRAGIAGILRVLRALQMIGAKGVSRAKAKPILVSETSWLRAPVGGLMRGFKGVGEFVEEDELLGMVSDPFGKSEEEIRSDTAGIVIGRSFLPVANEGDALFHIAQTRHRAPEDTLETHATQLEADPMFDEDEII